MIVEQAFQVIWWIFGIGVLISIIAVAEQMSEIRMYDYCASLSEEDIEFMSDKERKIYSKYLGKISPSSAMQMHIIL